MANRIILLYSIDELKKKLTRFSYSEGGFFGGYKSIDLVKDDMQIKSVYCHSLKEGKEYSIDKEKWDEFVNKMFELNIHKWKRKYNNNDICDGSQWELKMEFNDLPNFESFGSNEYPKNWELFEDIIFEYFPEMQYTE